MIKNTKLLFLDLEKKISQQNLLILFLFRGGPWGDRLGCPPPNTGHGCCNNARADRKVTLMYLFFSDDK
jgi:hypothetical protein